MKIVTSHPGGGGSWSQCQQMTMGEGGSKIGQKYITYYLNGPFVAHLTMWFGVICWAINKTSFGIKIQ